MRVSKKAKGEFIAFLDDDDIWMENKVQRQIDIVGGDVDELFYGRNQIACYKAGKEQKV